MCPDVCPGIISHLIALLEVGVFDGIDVYATDNFIMGEKNMTFIYVEDEIAPHSMGEIRVVLDYGELNGIMKR